MRIDLHSHSTASDGTDSPAALVATAHAAGVDVLAITDHDTTGGWAAATEALPGGMTLIPGTEFSCVYRPDATSKTSLHLLGYLYDPQHPALRAERARLRAERLGRGEVIVGRMTEDGIPITWEQVLDFAEGGAVGRPHIGRALVAAGVVPDVNAAFADLLSSRSRYYVGTQDTDVFQAIGLVLAAGGVPVFAHPLARRRGKVVGDDVIRAMAAAGLAGIEVDHPDHDEPDRIHLAGLARELDLIATGSSDYHGTNKSTGIAACTTAQPEYERLISLATGFQPIRS